MKLKSFRVRNFRSINDSGIIELAQQTVLVGRNESGKTNLLLALRSLNPADEPVELSYVKDFPRERHPDEFSDALEVLETLWELTDVEKDEVFNIYPRVAFNNPQEVLITRNYKGDIKVKFMKLEPETVDFDKVRKLLGKIQHSINGSLSSVDESTSKAISAGLKELSNNIVRQSRIYAEIADNIKKTIADFRQSAKGVNYQIPENANSSLEEILKDAIKLAEELSQRETARKLIKENIPIFIYLSEYPEIEGHQDIPNYLSRLQNRQLTEEDLNFGKLCTVAGLNPKELNDLLAQNHEIRQQLTNRAGAIVTKKVRQLWTDRQLKIRFNLDANHFDTLVADPSSIYDVEINLNERSRGFKWFFSFYITFAADTAGGYAENAILLLDEPGLYLHAVAQKDLIGHFANDFKNQIIYTTHSPFMIPTDNITSIRTLNIDQETGTTVTNDPTGDERTLFPIQTALGYDLTQTLFVGERNIVVEGVTDYWYLAVISDYLRELKKVALPYNSVVTPAGGAQKIAYMVALLTSQRLKVLVLLDSEKQSRISASDMIKSKLIKDEYVIFVDEAFNSQKPIECDIEDLLDPAIFEALVIECYKDELAGKSPTLNKNIPRIVKRFEDAFSNIGLEFHKTRPAKLFIQKMAKNPTAVLTTGSQEKFESLFAAIDKRIEKLAKTNGKPFI